MSIYVQILKNINRKTRVFYTYKRSLYRPPCWLSHPIIGPFIPAVIVPVIIEFKGKTSFPGSLLYAPREEPGYEVEYKHTQSRSPSLRSSGRNVRLWDNPFQGGI
jgi:hypothetical protein